MSEEYNFSVGDEVYIVESIFTSKNTEGQEKTISKINENRDGEVWVKLSPDEMEPDWEPIENVIPATEKHILMHKLS